MSPVDWINGPCDHGLAPGSCWDHPIRLAPQASFPMTDLAAIRDQVKELPEVLDVALGYSVVRRSDVLALLADTPSVEPTGLDEARREAMAALPEGWTIREGHPWRDRDFHGDAVWRVAAGPPDRFGEGAHGPTPEAALRALAALLPTQASDSPEKT